MPKVSSMAASRLRSDYMRIKRDPVPYITAEPLPSNILEWHYVVQGPPDSPYEAGLYHGRLIFPSKYPFKPPSIYMITPSGRFKTDTRLCLSISDFHPDTWNPAWSASTILIGLLSFMLEKQPTAGSIESTDAEKRDFASKSAQFNLDNKVFRELFPEIVQTIQSKQQPSSEELSEKALPQKDDIEEPTLLATKTARGDGKRGSKGGAPSNGRGGARGRGGRGNGPSDSDRGTQQRGSRGRGSNRGLPDGDRGRGSHRGSDRGQGAGCSNARDKEAKSN